ncbi:hypothetical protein SLA2020_159100 [Shorea laevis]
MAATKKLSSLFPLFSLLCFISIFLLSLFIRAIPSLPNCQQRNCPLPQLDPLKFLETYRDTNIGFIGDSLNKNMFVSLFCTLKGVSSEVKKWRPAGADRGFTFLRYNLTIAYHRINLLVRYGRWSASDNGGELETLGFKEVIELMLMWFAPSKFDPVKSPKLFFENNLPVIPPIHPDVGLVKALKNMIVFVARGSRPGTIKFFRTQSPRHFEGVDWNQGGSCQRLQPLLPEQLSLQIVFQVEDLFSLKNNRINVEARMVNQHLYKALGESNFHVLDITRMSEFRADAHPATAGGKKHDDCMHWWLPGITDTWNDLFVTHLNGLKTRN